MSTPPPLARSTVPGRARRCGVAALLAGVLALAGAPAAGAHSGELDEWGGHFDERTGGYHYHRPAWNLAQRSREYLKWKERGRTGVLVGEVARINRPDAVWVHLPNRPAFQRIAQHLSAQNRDDKRARVKVWFRYVSPEASARTESRDFIAWFFRKVAYELEQKLMGETVTVQFRIVPVAGRLEGMVLHGGENINLWLVLNGWSYPIVQDGENPYAEKFQQAEELARQDKAGLWGR